MPRRLQLLSLHRRQLHRRQPPRHHHLLPNLRSRINPLNRLSLRILTCCIISIMTVTQPLKPERQTCRSAETSG